LDVPEDSQLMQEEIFGPLLPIITVSTEWKYAMHVVLIDTMIQRSFYLWFDRLKMWKTVLIW
jgi:acyl-CoA reductase-like NAD-dependent aldehyde dehydrogenase